MIYLSDKKGFTLLEIIVSLSILSILILGAMEMFNVSFRADNFVQEGGTIQADAAKIVQTFIDELRTANYSNIGGYPIASASGTEIVFYANIDRDILIEKIRYFVNGNSFYKGVTKPTGTLLYSYVSSTEQITVLARNLQTPIGNVFTYYNEYYNGTTNTSTMPYPIILPDVRIVGLNLRLKQNTAANAPIFEVQTKVQIRSLKTN